MISILQNGERARISFFGAHANPPVGVALLLAAVFGVLLVALPGTARIVQLRMLARRRGRAAAPPAESILDQRPEVLPDQAPVLPDEPPAVPEPLPDMPGAPAGPGPRS